MTNSQKTEDRIKSNNSNQVQKLIIIFFEFIGKMNAEARQDKYSHSSDIVNQATHYLRLLFSNSHSHSHLNSSSFAEALCAAKSTQL